MGFLIPVFLAGLAFAGIPVALHFLYRRRTPQVPFAATRFLKVAVTRTARRRRIDNLLLLALRTLLLALLAVGLAGPVVKRATGGGREGGDVVVILDNSLSMSAVEDGEARFARGKEAAASALGRLAAGDLAALVTTAPPESLAEEGLTPDASALRARLWRLAPSHARGSLPAALARAGALLAESTAQRKLVYVITDLQANAFPARETLGVEARSGLEGVPVVVYDCGSGGGRNVWIESVSVSTQGVVAGSPLEVTARVRSDSPERETVAVSLSAGPERLARRGVTIEPGGTTEARLTTIARDAGVFEGFVEVETADSLAADNRRYFALLVRERIKALILKAGRAEQPFDDDAFFLERALDPFRGSGGAGGPFEATAATYDEAPRLEGYDIVFLLLGRGMPEELSERLEAYADSGGAVAVFASDDAEPGALSAWLPARLVTLRRADGEAGESFTIGSLDTSHPSLAAFADEPPALYNTIRVYAHWLLAVEEAGAVVTARFGGGAPAMVESRSEDRRVALFALAPVRRMGTLATSQFFLPLVYETAYRMLSAQPGGGEALAGAPVRLAGARGAAEGLVVRSPDGASRLVTAGAGEELIYTDAHAPGSYVVMDAQALGARAVFSVNVDPLESDLRRLDAAGAALRAPGGPVLSADSVESLDRALSSLEPVLAFGDVLLYSVLALALGECLAANRTKGRAASRR